MTLDRFVRPTSRQLVTGWVAGRVDVGLLPSSEFGARRALERCVLAALIGGRTCFVSFSGGRDSSAVLAVATHVARREGVALPVPVTLTYPGLPDTDEAQWQELVLRHLGITERVVVPIRGEMSLLGPYAQDSLRRRGLLWPAAFQVQHGLFSQIASGHLLTGEGGDEIIGIRRGTPIGLVFRARRRPGRPLVKAAALAVLPSRLTGRRQRSGSLAQYQPWLTPRAVAIRMAEMAEFGAMPLSWRASTWWLLGRSAIHALIQNYRELGVDYQAKVSHPLLDTGFVAALAREGGLWGYPGRTALMRHLFSDVLPDALLSRSSKARFNTSRYTDVERDFARGWDGSGVDTGLVDVERLRAYWLSPNASSGPGLLMQSVWMQQQGLDPFAYTGKSAEAAGSQPSNRLVTDPSSKTS